MSKTREQIIYCVGFHTVKPKGRYQNYQFASRKKAYSFFESIKNHPNVLDGYMYTNHLFDMRVYDGVFRKDDGELLDSFNYFNWEKS